LLRDHLLTQLWQNVTECHNAGLKLRSAFDEQTHVDSESPLTQPPAEVEILLKSKQ
jgi:hypothetical protein